MPSPEKMLNFPPDCGDLVETEDVGDVVNRLSELQCWFSFVLHCNASNLVLEIVKHGKIRGTICISVPSLRILEGLIPRNPVIYAHYGGMWAFFVVAAAIDKLCFHDHDL